VERWRFVRERLALGDNVDCVPLGGGEDDIAGHFRTVAPKHGEKEHTPGADHVERQSGFESFEFLEVQFFDAASSLEDLEVDLDIPFLRPL